MLCIITSTESTLTSVASILIPILARLRVMASPNPEPAPVTTAARPNHCAMLFYVQNLDKPVSLSYLLYWARCVAVTQFFLVGASRAALEFPNLQLI